MTPATKVSSRLLIYGVDLDVHVTREEHDA